VKLKDLVTLQEISLSNDMLWSNEFDWAPVASTNTYTLTGALIIEQGTKQAGRAITLTADPEMAWVTRATLELLRAAAAIQYRKFTLTLEYPTDTRAFTVIFDNTSGPVKATPAKGFPGHKAGDWFRIELKFLEVPA
jgi:hypothetical protein